MDPIAVDIRLIRAVLGAELRVAPGRALMARVMSADATGRGSLSIAGAVIEARLPKDVQPGQELRLTVRDVTPERVVLSLSEQAGGPAPNSPVELPGGGTVRVAERDASEQAHRGGGGAGRHTLALVYDAPALGPVDLRFELDPQSLRVSVVLGAGEPAEQAQDRAGELRDALAEALGARWRSRSRPGATRWTYMPEPTRAPARHRSALREGRAGPARDRHRRRPGRRAHPRRRPGGGHPGPPRSRAGRGARQARAGSRTCRRSCGPRWRRRWPGPTGSTRSGQPDAAAAVNWTRLGVSAVPLKLASAVPMKRMTLPLGRWFPRMALRLTGIPTPDDSSGSSGDAPARPGGLRIATALAPTTQAGSAFGAQLRDQARLQLAINQLDRYEALFDRAAEHEDSHARYHARVLLIEEGLAATGKTSSLGQATQLFVTVAQAVLTALEEEPREPILLNYAGVALYELWSLDAAHALFKAAHRLDPGLPHLTRNLQELARRRKGRRPNKPLHLAVPGLAARARKLAPKAQPAKGLTLSLCMIVRDEEEMLPKCLAAAAPAVDEIIIVDTGSKDRTIEIADEYGARVIEKEWTGSFSDARNVSFEAATSDWIIYLDADEVLVDEDARRLKALTGRVWREAFYLVLTSYTGELDDADAVTNSVLRVFRNRPHYRFEGRLHEQIAHGLPTYAAGRIEQSSVRVDHYGYLGAVRDAKEKSRRNLELLKAQQAESAPSAFLHFNLGTRVRRDRRSPCRARRVRASWKLVESNGEEAQRLRPRPGACARSTRYVRADVPRRR